METDRTSAQASQPSLHLTVGMETMLDGSRLSHSWESVLGLNGGRHEHVAEAFYSALGSLVNARQAGTYATHGTIWPFRASVPRTVLRGAWSEEEEDDAIGRDSAAREHARKLLHMVVDEMVDGTSMLPRIGAHLTHELWLYRHRLEQVTQAAVMGRPMSLSGNDAGQSGWNNKDHQLSPADIGATATKKLKKKKTLPWKGGPILMQPLQEALEAELRQHAAHSDRLET